MLEINWGDVISILNTCKQYLVFLGVFLAAAVIVTVAVRKVEKKKRKFIRSQTWIAALLVLVVIVNMICVGPMSTLISLATGNGTIAEETSDDAIEVCVDIAEEGIVLLKNEDDVLPLDSTKNLNVFGWAATNPFYGGVGSGSLSDAYEKVTLLQSLEDAGFNLNTELLDFYADYMEERPTLGGWGGLVSQDWSLPEPTADSYSTELLDHAKDFSDKAVIVLSRLGGEGGDLPTDMSEAVYTNNSTEYDDFEEGGHYLELSRTERDMIELVCDHFDDVVLIYNGANAMELGFVNEYEEIKSVLWCPMTGHFGFTALGPLLNGEVNPSGKTSDIFVADLTKAPTFENFGNFIYDNMGEFGGENIFTGTEMSPSFVNYVEGIYVGYRFYETAAEEQLINYDEEVVFPFGHGLSYTEFSQEMGELTENNGTISFDVTVTNIGDTAGKDVVEVYYNPPYVNGGIEKASANLAAFAKTQILEPGESETVTIEFLAEDMASYDPEQAQAYVLEEGDYGISIRSDSHTILEEKQYTVENTIVYDESNPRSTDQVSAVNQFDDAAGDVTYLSRADGFANYEEAVAGPSDYSLSEDRKANFMDNSNYDPTVYNDDSDEMPALGADNGIELADLRGMDYDAEEWEDLLDELTIEDMDTLIALGGYQTPVIDSINKIQTIDNDGPACINNNFTGAGSVGFPCETMLACSWNVELAKAFGESIGKMADEMGVSGWYAPAMNIHRSAFAGRNYEYYSEDGVLSGKMAANAVIGAEEYGVYAYIKHYALNDQETNRMSMLCTWADEQSIREIYLKPFELAVKEGKAKAVMSSFNFIGITPAYADPALLNTVLRDEWGFEGFVLTDYFGGYGYQDADRGIRNGNDSMLIAYDSETNHVTDTESATSVLAMRQASKNILYTIVNSRAYAEENINAGMQNWQIAVIVIDAVLAVVLILLEVMAIRKWKKKENVISEERESEKR